MGLKTLSFESVRWPTPYVNNVDIHAAVVGIIREKQWNRT